MLWIIAYNLAFWSIVATVLYGYWRSLRSSWQWVREHHRIPCSRCVYFTGNYRLKCTVHPCSALSPQAINCPDFEPRLYER
ncbi:MAG: hypothetical protein RMK91_05825 [Pseudanabaenaceae cyanobacterium SKYGB_i_bin29]|nr:hypothetical protein [Pseudanabaenaceae cyanobacterium SKYG29]MDW8421369.1 hypothetical protein [Pseudanabaenaceae cyanobacterium SKYGB_i_bin29]